MAMASSPMALNSPKPRPLPEPLKMAATINLHNTKTNQVGTVLLYGIPIVSLVIENQERLCLAQISNTLLKEFSYNEIHNRRVALGITCVQCTPVQLEILRRAGAMPVSSRRCGMITRREAERLCKSFLGDNTPPRLPDDFAFSVHHECAWGCRGAFLPSRYNSSRAKCIKCTVCGLFFSPNKFIFHSHRTGPNAKYVQPDAANFNSWRRHMRLSGTPPQEVVHAWEDVKAMFNGGTRKRLLQSATQRRSPPVKPTRRTEPSPPPFQMPAPPQPTRVPPIPLVMDYVWHHGIKPFSPYSALPWLGLPPTSPLLLPPTDGKIYPSAFRPVYSLPRARDSDDEEVVDIETCPEDDVKPCWSPKQKTLVQADLAVQADANEGVAVAEDCEELNSRSPPRVEEQRIWRLTDRELYREEVARQLHIMRELVGPSTGNEIPNSASTFLPLAQSLDASRRNRGDKSISCHQSSPAGANLSPVDCTTCHQMAGTYNNVLPLSKTSDTTN